MSQTQQSPLSLHTELFTHTVPRAQSLVREKKIDEESNQGTRVTFDASFLHLWTRRGQATQVKGHKTVDSGQWGKRGKGENKEKRKGERGRERERRHKKEEKEGWTCFGLPSFLHAECPVSWLASSIPGVIWPQLNRRETEYVFAHWRVNSVRSITQSVPSIFYTPHSSLFTLLNVEFEMCTLPLSLFSPPVCPVSWIFLPCASYVASVCTLAIVDCALSTRRKKVPLDCVNECPLLFL